MSLPNFWDDSKKSSEIIEQLNSLKSVVKNIEDLLYKVNDIKDRNVLQRDILIKKFHFVPT